MGEAMVVDYTPNVLYPESDGEPVGETDVHRDETFSLIAVLKDHFADQPDVYVAGDNFIYFEEGNPRAVISPDVYVVWGVAMRQRRIYKLWEEGVAPGFVMELTSRSTRVQDLGNKRAICADLGVVEYFLFDPEADTLDPPLRGYRLEGGEYLPIAPRADGAVESKMLGMWLWVDDGIRLQCILARTGERLLRHEDIHAAKNKAEQERDEALARARALEQELEQLRSKR